MITDTYNSIAGASEGIYKEKGSKFLSFAFPVDSEEEAMDRLEEIRKSYSKARHHCFAYRIGIKGLRFRTNDAGEPSGTAGRPILGQIDHFGLTNLLIVVVRYFGGTKLGTSGLISAYRAAAEDALVHAKIVEKVREMQIRLTFSYGVMNEVMGIIKNNDVRITEQSFEIPPEMQISFRQNLSETLIPILNDIDTLVLEITNVGDED